MRSPSYISKACRWGLSQHGAFSTPASGHLGQLKEGSGHAFIISVPCLPFQLQVWKCFVSRCLVIFNDNVFNFCFEPWSFSLAFPTVILSSLFDRCLREIAAWGNRGSEVQMQPGRQSLGSCPLSHWFFSSCEVRRVAPTRQITGRNNWRAPLTSVHLTLPAKQMKTSCSWQPSYENISGQIFKNVILFFYVYDTHMFVPHTCAVSEEVRRSPGTGVAES